MWAVKVAASELIVHFVQLRVRGSSSAAEIHSGAEAIAVNDAAVPGRAALGKSSP